MDNRIQLQSLLEETIGSQNVYFQPPETYNLRYPCIVYSFNDESTLFANNKLYNRQRQYRLIIIDKNPDSLLPAKVAELQMCKFDRPYTSDNLNHYVYNIYY